MSPAIKNDRFEGSGGVMGCQLFRRPLPALTAHSSGRSPFDHFILFFFFLFFLLLLLFSFLFYFFLCCYVHSEKSWKITGLEWPLNEPTELASNALHLRKLALVACLQNCKYTVQSSLLYRGMGMKPL